MKKKYIAYGVLALIAVGVYFIPRGEEEVEEEKTIPVTSPGPLQFSLPAPALPPTAETMPQPPTAETMPQQAPAEKPEQAPKFIELSSVFLSPQEKKTKQRDELQLNRDILAIEKEIEDLSKKVEEPPPDISLVMTAWTEASPPVAVVEAGGKQYQLREGDKVPFTNVRIVEIKSGEVLADWNGKPMPIHMSRAPSDTGT